MGLKSTGSSPVFPKMYYNSNALVTNHVNISLTKKLPFKKVIFSKKIKVLMQSLLSSGIIHSLFTYRIGKFMHLKFSIFFYKNVPFFHKVKNVSTPSKKFYISLKALKILTTTLKATTVILSTSKGIITHREALRHKVGGLIFFIVS